VYVCRKEEELCELKENQGEVEGGIHNKCCSYLPASLFRTALLFLLRPALSIGAMNGWIQLGWSAVSVVVFNHSRQNDKEDLYINSQLVFSFRLNALP
jgi:hypothetical protein